MRADKPGMAAVEGGAPPRGTSRRDVFRLALGAAAVAAGLAVLRRVLLPGSLHADGRATLEALLDTLLVDEGLPDWRSTGVMPRLADELAARRQGRRALVEGVAWLDARAREVHGRTFRALPPAARAGVVASAERSGPGSLPHYFYRVVRDRAVELHYAHPSLWRPLGLPHPPQPEGYPDFAEAPPG